MALVFRAQRAQWIVRLGPANASAAPFARLAARLAAPEPPFRLPHGKANAFRRCRITP
jgi:hypothetical protein